VDEPDGKYWHVMIFYRSEHSAFSKLSEQKEKVPIEFIDEIEDFLGANPQVSARASNAVRMNMNSLYNLTDFIGFSRFRRLGTNTIEKEDEFFKEIMRIIEKNRFN